MLCDEVVAVVLVVVMVDGRGRECRAGGNGRVRQSVGGGGEGGEEARFEGEEWQAGAVGGWGREREREATTRP